MLPEPHSGIGRGHAHGVDLEATFDFLNTVETDRGVPIERLSTLEDALLWFVERRVIHGEGADRARTRASIQPALATRDLEHVRAVRDAMREVAEATVERRAPRASALTTVNKALHARQVIELVPGSDGVAVDHRHVGDPIDDALARLTDPLVSELTAGHPERIRICASETCKWIFYDASRTSRRRWCEMSTCGNRAKAARHRARARSAQPPGA
jgi:predicted RNA-binding Zn ribbon-like protein